jgi:hypothetical protein
LGGFLTFFFTLYVNQNTDRYFGLYRESTNCQGRIFDVATIVSTLLPFEHATRLVRYMNAAHTAGYVGLSPTYSSSGFFKQMNAKMGLLTERELARMTAMDLDSGGHCYRELIAWCLADVNKAHKQGWLDDEAARQVREHVLALRGSLGFLYGAVDLPVPFFYVHFISLLSILYLPLFAASSAIKAGTGESVYWTADLISGLVVVFQAIFVIGLRILGQTISDPYGDDLIGFSVISFCKYAWVESNRILASSFPIGEATVEEEKDLIQQRLSSLGMAWEPGDDPWLPKSMSGAAR